MKLIRSLDAAMAGDPRDLPRVVRQPHHPPAGSRGETDQKGRPLAGVRLAAEVSAEHEAELAAMHAVLAELRPLGGAARARVLKWVDEVLAPTPGTHEPADEVDL